MRNIIIPTTVSNLVTYTRELRSVEKTLLASDTSPQLRRSLQHSHKALMDTRQAIVLGLLQRNTDVLTMTWICQHASDYQLMNLYCDRDDDHIMIAMANKMMTSV